MQSSTSASRPRVKLARRARGAHSGKRSGVQRATMARARMPVAGVPSRRTTTTTCPCPTASGAHASMSKRASQSSSATARAAARPLARDESKKSLRIAHVGRDEEHVDGQGQPGETLDAAGGLDDAGGTRGPTTARRCASEREPRPTASSSSVAMASLARALVTSGWLTQSSTRCGTPAATRLRRRRGGSARAARGRPASRDRAASSRRRRRR